MSGSRFVSVRLALAVALVLGGVMTAYAILSETPVGELKGCVVAQESGNRLESWISLRGKPDKSGLTGSFDRHSANGSFRFTRLPAGEYTLSVRTRNRHAPPMKVVIEEGRIAEMNVELAPGKPFLDLYIHQHVFIPREAIQITLKGYVESSAFDVSMYRVDLDSFLLKSSGSLQRLLGVNSYYGDTQAQSRVDLAQNAALAPVESFKQNISGREADGCFTQRIDLPSLGPGLYVLSTKAGDIQRLGWVMVTSLGLVTKTAGGQMLAYTTDLKTGAVVASADVKVYGDSSELAASGVTGPDGLVSLDIPIKSGESTERTIVARSGESFAFVSAYLSSSESSGNLIYSYTDRPVYRPGQKVYFRGIARRFADGRYQVVAGKLVTVEVRDPRDTLIYRGTKTTDRFGCYHGELDLNPETGTGVYSLVSTVEGGGREEGGTFKVAAYSKPEFSVKVEFSRKRYVRNEQVQAKVVAAYYFGAPVVNAKVSYVVRRAPYWLFAGDDEDFEQYGGYEDYGGYGEWIDEKQVTTDENGIAEITFPAAWPEPEEEDGWDSDQEFSIEAYVTDAGRRSADGAGSVVVTRGQFAVDVTPDRYVVQPGTPVSLRIDARDYEKRPVGNREISVIIGREYWNEREEGFERWQERKVRTDASGRASLTFTPKGAGSVRVTARARDNRGNRIVSSSYVWCYGDAWEDSGAQLPDLQIVMDKKVYDPGDTATVLINTSKPGASALVTVEGPRIYDRFTVPLKGNSTAVQVPVRAEYRPNFYVGVCFVRNKSFAEQQARARVSLDTQKLRVKVQPNKRRYLPGEKASYEITTTDAKGRPASAELSLGVVDEAIYAIAEDHTTPILDHFYARKPNEVNTRFSFPEIYLSDPDKAAASAKMPRRALSDVYTRKRFLDTAFWKPDIITDAHGRANVSFDLPDNLTTWRATVRAITLDTVCGDGRESVLAQQDLLVRLETPRFLVQGDRTTVSAVVHNYTGTGQRVKVDFQAPGLNVEGDRRPTITVREKGSQRVDWTVRAPKPGEFPITVQAKSDVTGDAMQIVVPVHPHGEERTTTFTGDLAGTASKPLVIDVRRDSIPEATRLTLRLAPSLASSMLGSLDYLARYPYGCTEQTTSSFLPDVILSRSMKDLGISNPDLERKLPDMVAKGLFRLYRFQLEDGGWSWCEYGKADPWMTAYVCYGLVQARNAGFAVNPEVVSSGLSALKQLARRPKLDAYTRAYAQYVLALSGSGSQEALISIAREPSLTNPTLAVLALGLAETGRSDWAQSTLDKLITRAISETGMLHWSGGESHGFGDVEATATALQAMLRLNPFDPRAPQIVRWLMRERQANYWYSTRDTALTLYALSDFLKATKELAPDYDAQVYLNGKKVMSANFDAGSIFDPDRVISLPQGSLRKGRNELVISKSGDGNLYYSAGLKQYLAKNSIPATVTGSGVTVTRSYYKPGRRYEETGLATHLGSAVSGCASGDVILVKLTVNASKRLSHLLLEDFIPAGCEIVDKGHADYWDWDYWWVGRDIRDEKISFYLDSLSPGTHVVTYRMRAGIPGDYHSMPAQVFAMYDPRVRSTTAEAPFEVRR